MKREASDLFIKLVFNFDAEEWNEFELAKLRTWELSILSQLLGGPKSLERTEFVTRILCTREVRFKIARYASDRAAAEQLAADHRKEALKWMAKQMKLWRSGSKIQLAITLIQWRDRCRMEGQKRLEELRAVNPTEPTQPRQLRLFA
ncbi:MAG TPA: hypothetical protein VK961_06920 [Chthoniobacter sp.]|nr:hypothetical protein [Chthoniobacter sp.]